MKIHERIYRIFLKAYSNTFQREYGESMTQLFRDQLKDAVARRKLLPFWKRIVLDLFRTAPASYTPAWRVLFAAACSFLLTYGLMRTSSSPSLWTVHASSSWVVTLANEIAHFVVLNTVLVLQPFCIFLTLTDRFDWNKYVRGLLAALPIFAIGRLVWVPYMSWKALPLYLGLAVAIWISLATDPKPEAEPHSL